MELEAKRCQKRRRRHKTDLAERLPKTHESDQCRTDQKCRHKPKERFARGAYGKDWRGTPLLSSPNERSGQAGQQHNS